VRRDHLEHELPRHGVEERPNVDVDHPVVFPAPSPTGRDRVQRRAPRPIAVGIRVEDRFDLRLQMPGHDRLRDPVRDRGHAEQPGTRAVRFRYLHRPHRGRKVGSRRHPVPDLVQVALEIGLELGEGLLVHPGCALILFDLLVGLPDVPLRDIERLAC
jgi:hypothetical protein